MSTFHAVVWMDQAQAQIVHFNREHAESTQVRSHQQRKARAAHQEDAAYYADIVQALQGSHEILLTGPGGARGHFLHWLQQHRPQLAPAIVASEALDHPSPAQLVALARRFFKHFDQLAIDPSFSGA